MAAGATPELTQFSDGMLLAHLYAPVCLIPLLIFVRNLIGREITENRTNLIASLYFTVQGRDAFFLNFRLQLTTYHRDSRAAILREHR